MALPMLGRGASSSSSVVSSSGVGVGVLAAITTAVGVAAVRRARRAREDARLAVVKMTPTGPFKLSSSLWLRSWTRADEAGAAQLFINGQNEYGENERYLTSVFAGDMKDVEASYLKQPGSDFWVVVDQQQHVRGTVAIHPTSIGDPEYHKTLNIPKPTPEELKTRGPFAGQECELRRMVVHPSVRSQRVATRLLDRLTAFARSCGYDAVHLTTLEHMTPATRLYERYGFKLIKQETIFFRAHGRDQLELVHYRLPLL